MKTKGVMTIVWKQKKRNVSHNVSRVTGVNIIMGVPVPSFGNIEPGKYSNARGATSSSMRCAVWNVLYFKDYIDNHPISPKHTWRVEHRRVTRVPMSVKCVCQKWTLHRSEWVSQHNRTCVKIPGSIVL